VTDHDSEWIFADGVVDPIDHTAKVVGGIFYVRDAVKAARNVDPAAFPTFIGDLDDLAFARRVIGRMLDLGWTPPRSSASSPVAEAMSLVLHTDEGISS